MADEQVEAKVDPKDAQAKRAKSIYRCGVCGAQTTGDWPPCCKDGRAFAAAHPGAAA